MPAPQNSWWPGTESNRRRQPFQGCALPTELPGHFKSAIGNVPEGALKVYYYKDRTRAEYEDYNKQDFALELRQQCELIEIYGC